MKQLSLARRMLRVGLGLLLAAVLLSVALLPALADRVPRNVIVFVSDGMGFPQVEATGYYLHGEAGAQVYERFPVRLGMSTYMAGDSYDPQAAWADFDYVRAGATDSAAAATTMSTGVKTYGGAIGVDPDGQPLEHWLQRARRQGKRIGVLTDVQLSHATPAGFIAHAASRGEYSDIARQMILYSDLTVLMGAGHPYYDNSGNRLGEPHGFSFVGGEGEQPPAYWEDLMVGRLSPARHGGRLGPAWTVLQTREQFRELAATSRPPRRALGLIPAQSTVQQSRSGDALAAPFEVPLVPTVPSLEEMVCGALNVLGQGPEGFAMLVEAGAVDWTGHSNQPGRLIEEMAALAAAVEAACRWVEQHSSWAETLVVVTSDHETGYLTGTGSGPEADPPWQPVENRGAGRVPGMEFHSGGHTNSLVPLYARGAGAELIAAFATREDPVRGPYLDNAELAQALFQTLGQEAAVATP